MGYINKIHEQKIPGPHQYICLYWIFHRISFFGKCGFTYLCQPLPGSFEFIKVSMKAPFSCEEIDVLKIKLSETFEKKL